MYILWITKRAPAARNIILLVLDRCPHAVARARTSLSPTAASSSVHPPMAAHTAGGGGGLPCFVLPLVAAAVVPICSPKARTNWGRPLPRRTDASRPAARARTGDGKEVLSGCGKPDVKGPLLSIDMSLDTERSNVRVAYQGSPGTVIEAMVLKAFPKCIPVPHKRSEGAFEAVESSLADKAILPIENSSIGSFHQSYDLLLSHNLQIVQEVQMDVELCLLALPGVQKDDLQIIFSRPEDLAQCEYSLSNLGVSKKNVDHGAAGAEIISKQDLRDAGVIGSARAAELYGLNMLECNFQDASPNVTRYLVLARTASIPKEYGQYKTSIVFGLEEGPGTLYKALVVFWKRDINLTKIESRPNRGKPMRTLGTEKQFNYIFYLDFEASMSEISVQNVLKDLEEISSFLRVLGCYPYSTAI